MVLRVAWATLRSCLKDKSKQERRLEDQPLFQDDKLPRGGEVAEGRHQRERTAKVSHLVLSTHKTVRGSQHGHGWKPWRMGRGNRSQAGAAAATPGSPLASSVVRLGVRWPVASRWGKLSRHQHYWKGRSGSVVRLCL